MHRTLCLLGFVPIALLLVVFSSQAISVSAQTPNQSSRLDFVMDMVHDNPGEEPTDTKWRAPAFVKAIGFDAQVPHWMVQCALTYDTLPEGGVPANSGERKWIESHAAKVKLQMQTAEAAGVNVYPWTDFIVVPQSVWQKYGQRMGTLAGKVESGGDTKTVKPDIQTEWTQTILRAQVEEFFRRFPEADGITLRFGETYLHDAPHHIGGSPIREGQTTGVEDHIVFMNLMRQEVCVKRNKRLFYRTWDFGDRFHVNPEYYLAVTDQIEPHANLFLSIKHQNNDFHRRCKFNPCLGIGKHRQIVEVCCQLDSYGKGAHPYYIGQGVIDGWEEYANDPRPRGIKDLLPIKLSIAGQPAQRQLAGVFTWSRGGGWDGPQIKNELWTDLNTRVVAEWAMDTTQSEEQVFRKVVSRDLGFAGPDIDRLRQISLLSATAGLKGHCCEAGYVDVWWTRDEYISGLGRTNFAKDLSRLLDEGKQKAALQEKQKCVQLWQQIEQLASEVTTSSPADRNYLRVSSTYGRIKYALFEQAWQIMFAVLQHRRGETVDRQQLSAAIEQYDQLWQEFRQLKANNPQCATLYTDQGFRANPEQGIGATIKEAREIANQVP